jgi:hypothetical protein
LAGQLTIIGGGVMGLMTADHDIGRFTPDRFGVAEGVAS